MLNPVEKELVWVGSAKKDLKKFPGAVMRSFGFALYEAQLGGKSDDARPLHGFGGASVLEIVEDHATDTYRAVYTVRFEGRVYVLHAFQKKSKKGDETTQADMDLIRARLKTAEANHKLWLEKQRK